MTYTNDEQYRCDCDESYDSVLEPLFAVLWVETSFCEVTKKFWLNQEFFAYGGARGWTERSERAKDGEETTCTDICERIVPIEADKRGSSL
jgi:hypothetical protein